MVWPLGMNFIFIRPGQDSCEVKAATAQQQQCMMRHGQIVLQIEPLRSEGYGLIFSSRDLIVGR